MNRRTRNKLCIWIIIIGLINCLAYTIVYAYIGGDARNGEITEDGRYMVRGHYLRGQEGKETTVTRAAWIYSYLHSITIWPTQAAVLVAMLILARPHIIATMKEDSFISGPTFVTVSITIIVLVVSVTTIWFLLDFMIELSVPSSWQVAVVAALVLGGLASAFVARRRLVRR
jgi:hypothetical protein